jgi:hypothetical protein
VRTVKQRVVCECCAKINCVEIALTDPKSVREALSRSDRDQFWSNENRDRELEEKSNVESCEKTGEC